MNAHDHFRGNCFIIIIIIMDAKFYFILFML